MTFPHDFLWGASTSSHQVEGNNTNNDWWQWETQGRVNFPSKEACRHYDAYPQDFKLAKQLNHNAHRFSIEWSRIEPEEGQFDQLAIDHYQQVIESLHQNQITPIVTLHHFTHPVWFTQRGGWLPAEAPAIFCRYVRKVTESLGKHVTYWITINEPVILVYFAYLMGLWPPGATSGYQGWRVFHQLIKAHRLAYKTIHAVCKEQGWDHPVMVSLAKSQRPFYVCPQINNIFSRMGVSWRETAFNQYFLDRAINWMDFIGINYYEPEYVTSDKKVTRNLLGDNCNLKHHHFKHYNQLGWPRSPKDLYEVLSRLKKYNKPIIICENGTCEHIDQDRWHFIEEHVEQVRRAINDGVDVKGYCYWSLLDNFEWHHGYDIRFGLIEVDYTTYQRTIRPSAVKYAELIKNQ